MHDQADELILIHSIGIDKSEKGYRLTMQTYDTTNAEGKAVASSIGENIKILTCQGDTIYTALRQSENTEGKKFFTGHNMLIVLGYSVVNEDIHKALNYFVNDDLTFNGIIVATTKGKASDIIDIDSGDDTLSASSMSDIINKSVHDSRAVNPQIVGIVNGLASERSTTVLPVIIGEDESGEKNFKVVSTAIIKDSVYIGTLNEDETIGLNLLTGKAKTLSLSIRVNDEEASVFLDNISTKLRPQIENGKVVMETVISYDIAKREMLTDFNDSFYIPESEIKKAVEEKIRNECRSCIYKVITKYNCDVLDIEKYLKFYQKDYFNDAKNYFDGVISDITYDITIKGKVVD